LLVLGGGATLPAIALSGSTAGTVAQPVTVQSPGSVLAYFNAHVPLPMNAGTNTAWATSYCEVGAAFGISVLDGAAAQPGACAPLGTTPFASLNAFDATGETDSADFAVTDEPVTQAQYSTLAQYYPGRGEVVQVPFVASSVGIVFHNADVAGSYLQLTIPELCQIADGEITNWASIPKAADPTVTGGDPTRPVSETNPGFNSKPIYFIYRSDDNGLTLSLTNFFSAELGARALHCTGAAETWGLNDNFLEALPSAGSTATFVGAKNNAAEVSEVDHQDGSIGYVEPANFLASATFNTHFVRLFTLPVNDKALLKDPVSDLRSATRVITSFKKDGVVNMTCGNSGFVGGFTTPCADAAGRPASDLTAVTGAYKAGCLGIVDPLVYQAPALGYPIVDVSYLEFYSSGNGIYSNGLRGLGDELTNPSTVFGPGGITTVEKSASAPGTTGFSTLAIADVFYSNPVIGLLPTCID
jgi:hypothetical protein